MTSSISARGYQTGFGNEFATEAVEGAHDAERLRSWLADGEVWIAVQDEGPGGAPEELPRLFDHFYRTDKSRSRQSGGSGIGLSLARQFMEVHGGTIAAHNCSSGGLSICMGFGKPRR